MRLERENGAEPGKFEDPELDLEKFWKVLED